MHSSISRYCSVELASSGSLSLRVRFDSEGNSNFSAQQAQGIRIAARHCVGDLCEIRDGIFEWDAEDEDNCILLRSSTYGVFSEAVRITASPDEPAVIVRYGLEFLKEFDAHEIGSLLLRPEQLPVSPVIHLAGRQGVCPTQETVQHEVLVDEKVPIAGWIVKNKPEQSWWIASDDGVCAIADWYRGDAGVWAGLSAAVVPGWQYANYPATRTAWPEPLRFAAGARLSFTARITCGFLGDADKKGLLICGSADILRDEQEFIYAASILGTFRPYTQQGLWFNRTAIAIHHFYARYYDWSWMRDNCHGYLSAAMMAGSAVQEAFACQIDQWLKAPRNEHGVWPHNNGLAFYEGGELWKFAWATNLDTPSQLIEMAYLYACQTGDVSLILNRKAEILRAADAMEEIVMRNPLGRKLPWIDEHGDTYMDLGFIRGEQTYLTAVLYRGFLRLAVLVELFEMKDKSDFYAQMAARIKTQANLPTKEGGLWDGDASCYIGWRDPQGAIQPKGGHETYGNLVAIGCGLCSEAKRTASILAWLDRNQAVIYEKNACPMTHSNVPYPQWADGLTHSVPWICGWDMIARYSVLDPSRESVWNRYRKSFLETDYPFLEGSGSKTVEERSNRGRIWDSWGYLAAVWKIHLGLEPRLGHVLVHPSILVQSVSDTTAVYCWQNHRFEINLTGEGNRIQSMTVDGSPWPAAILPDRSCSIEIRMGECEIQPMIMDMDPYLSLSAVEYNTNEKILSVEAKTMKFPQWRYLDLSTVEGARLSSLSISGASDYEIVTQKQVRFLAVQPKIQLQLQFKDQ